MLQIIDGRVEVNGISFDMQEAERRLTTGWDGAMLRIGDMALELDSKAIDMDVLVSRVSEYLDGFGSVEFVQVHDAVLNDFCGWLRKQQHKPID